MKWLQKLIVGLTLGLFRFAADPMSAKWNFRIRFLPNQNYWAIELDEGGMDSWKALAHRVAEANNELVVKPFGTYYQARQYAADTGLDVAYCEVFGHRQRPELKMFVPHPMVIPQAASLAGLNLSEVTPAPAFEHMPVRFPTASVMAGGAGSSGVSGGQVTHGTNGSVRPFGHSGRANQH